MSLPNASTSAFSEITTVDPSNWMKKISNSTKISNISMPGSHDSCARNDFDLSVFPTGTARCQDLSITEQLESGTRVLDIRLKKQGENLQAWHGDYDGGVDQHINFDQIVNECKKFLNNHSKEAIFMFIKKETGDDFAAELEQKFQEDTQLWDLSKTMPQTLAGVRGKIVFLNRCKFLTSEGIDMSGISSHNNKKDFTFYVGDMTFHGQDLYEVPGDINNAPKNKLNAVVEMLEKSTANKDALNFYINFASGYYPTSILPDVFNEALSIFMSDKDIEVPQIGIVADYVNPHLRDYLQKNKVKTGFLMLDFVNKERNSAIISQNF